MSFWELGWNVGSVGVWGRIVETEDVVSKEFGLGALVFVFVLLVVVVVLVVVGVNEFCRHNVPPENRFERRGYFRREERRVSNLNSSGSPIRLGGVRVLGLSGNDSSLIS